MFRASACWRSPSTTITSAARVPINQQTRELISALENELAQHGPKIAGLLGKSQLASHAGGYLAPDEAGRHSSRAGLRDFGVQFVFRMPPVPRGHRARTKRSWRRARRRSTSCARSSTIRDSSRLPRNAARRARAKFRRTARQNVQIVYTRAQHPAFDGEHLRLRLGNWRKSGSWSLLGWASPTMLWSIRAAAARQASRGWSRTFWITCAR